MLFPGKSGKAVTYKAQHRRVKAALTGAGIVCSKVCHSFRHGVANHLDALGYVSL